MRAQDAWTMKTPKWLSTITAYAALIWSMTSAAHHVFALPPGFVQKEIFRGVGFAVDFVFTPDEKMIVVQKKGIVTVRQDPDGDYSYKKKTVALDISSIVCTEGERALGGVQVHPDFGVKNRYIYLYYTYNKNGDCLEDPIKGPVNRLSRFILSESWEIARDSEEVFLETPPLMKKYHNGGKIEFGKDGYMYVSIGDGGADSQAQNVGNLFGSIVRLTDQGEIPPDNPFAQDQDAHRCNVNGSIPKGMKKSKCKELYAIGLRNPWRFAMNPNTVGDKVQFYVNDVGANLWEEISDGGDDYQKSQDVHGITNYGWPVREGPCRRGRRTDCDDYKGYNHPIHYFMHGEDVGAAVTGGVFIPNGIWPSDYDGGYLYTEFVSGIAYLMKDSKKRDCLTSCNPAESRKHVTAFFHSKRVPVMRFGPYKDQTMALYYTSTVYRGGSMHRVYYSGADASKILPPKAVIEVDSLFVEEGATVQFNGTSSLPGKDLTPSPPSSSSSSSSSEDSDREQRDTDGLSYEWDFDGDGVIDSRLSEDFFTYDASGIYEAKLTVRDGLDGSDTSSVRVVVGEPQTFALTSGYPGPEFTWWSGVDCPSGYDFCGTLEFCQGEDDKHFGYRLPCADEPCECLGISGPLIRLDPGNRYKLTLRNTAAEKTNIHTHGLHIVGSGDSDDILRAVSGDEVARSVPGGGLCLDYTWEIPWDHPGGTYWYHPHVHGSVARQVAGGAFGMLIVEDNAELQSLPLWAQNELLLQIVMTETGVKGNGKANEIIPVNASQWYRLRVSVVSAEGAPFNLTFSDEGSCDVHKVASDGVWRSVVPGPAANVYELSGASRADFALRCNASSLVIPLHYGEELAAFIYVGPRETSPIVMNEWVPVRPYALSDLSNEVVPTANQYKVMLGYDHVNNQQWNPHVALATIGYDEIHEWLLQGTSEHPFHMHLYHLQVMTPGGCGTHEEGEFYDVISAPGDCLVRFRTADVGQRCVLHCHVLSHEDMGSMAWVNVTGVGMPRNEVESPEYCCTMEPSTPPGANSDTCRPSAVLFQGDNIETGDVMRSPISNLFLVQENDGNLALKSGTPDCPGPALWETGINKRRGEFSTHMEKDGNLVTRPVSESSSDSSSDDTDDDDIGMSPVWTSRTGKHGRGDGKYYLAFHCDGRSISIYKATPDNPDAEIWNSKQTDSVSNPEFIYALMPKEESAPIQEYFADDMHVSGEASNYEKITESKSSGSLDKFTHFLSLANDRHRIVQFYTSWCPQCHCFKDSHVKFARDLETLAAQVSEKVEFYAVSCVPWRDICRALGLDTYPTIRIYPSESDHGITVMQSELQALHVLRTLGVHIDGPRTESNREQFDQDERSSSFPVFVLGLWVTIVCFIFYMFRERSRLARSGRHKKVC